MNSDGGQIDTLATAILVLKFKSYRQCYLLQTMSNCILSLHVNNAASSKLLEKIILTGIINGKKLKKGTLCR